jgi:two-component system, LytTR family, sensor kinase
MPQNFRSRTPDPASVSTHASNNLIEPINHRLPRNLVYISFWLGVGLLLSLASLQTYVRRGGVHLWEPFLWEMSSVFVVALLMPLIYRWVSFADTCNWGKLQIGATHILMACSFSIAHVVLMFALRFLVYFLMDVRYEPGTWWSVIGYEAPKDFVTYALLAGICYGVVLMQREQRRELDIALIKTELSEARLARLQDQLQPHFLFNTLNLVSSLMAEDIERADTVLARLADLLRNTLALSNRTTHSLQEELHILEPYLDIMSARFGERVHVKINCDETARQCMIPCLLLLPLIENAVHHGVEKTTSPANIIVAAHIIANELKISVSTDVGALEREARDGGIGLANTRARLKQMYERSANINLIALQPRGVDVLITLPSEPQ